MSDSISAAKDRENRKNRKKKSGMKTVKRL